MTAYVFHILNVPFLLYFVFNLPANESRNLLSIGACCVYLLRIGFIHYIFLTLIIAPQ